MEPIYVILGIGLIILVIGVYLYNNLVSEQQRVSEAFSGVDVQLKKRQDLVPNLVDTVKGYAAHEAETLDAVINARNTAISAQTPGAMSDAEGLLGQTLGKLFALTEAYPDLKANTNFLQLQTELANIEDNIAAARRFYNASVQDFNTSVKQFPSVIIAGMFGFTSKDYFDLGESARQDLQTPPNVGF